MLQTLETIIAYLIKEHNEWNKWIENLAIVVTLSGATQLILSIPSIWLSKKKKKTSKDNIEKSKSTSSFQEPSPKIINANVNALDK